MIEPMGGVSSMNHSNASPLNNTTRYLIGLTVAPVQDFIREARKAQDIWSGSLTLSLMMRAGLLLLRKRDAEVISPYFHEEDETPNERARPKLTNELKAVVHGDEHQARELAKEVCDAILKYWRKEMAAETRNQLIKAEILKESECELWDKQIDAQFQATWAVAPIVGEGFKAEREAIVQVQRLLGAAKLANRFESYLGDSRLKCSLSGQWEALGEPGDGPQRLWGHPGRRERGELAHRMHRLKFAKRELYWNLLSRLEFDGREKLCSSFVVKRLAPVLVLTRGEEGFPNPKDDLKSPLRFPSTLSVAWVEQKQRLARWVVQFPGELKEPLQNVLDAIEAYCNASDAPQGRHWLPCHDEILKEVKENSPDLHPTIEKLLRIEGTFLNDPAGQDRDDIRLDQMGLQLNRQDNPELKDKLKGLKNSFHELKCALDKVQNRANPELAIGEVRLGRTPPLALIRADADRLGELQDKLVKEGGFERVRLLSKFLATKVMPKACDAVERDCMGKVIFAGGDELVAMVPARLALKAVEAIASAYEMSFGNGEFQDLKSHCITASIAVSVIDPTGPLRAAIEHVSELLDGPTKNHARPNPLDSTKIKTRHALGLTIIPGSGNVRQGVIGLTIPCPEQPKIKSDCKQHTEQAKQIKATWRVVADVLEPLADALSLPEGCGIEISPKIYRQWVAEFDELQREANLETEANDRCPSLPENLLPKGDDPGVALGEFARMAERHIQINAIEIKNLIKFQVVTKWLEHLSVTLPNGSDLDSFKNNLIRALTWRLRALLEAGSVVKKNGESQPSRWAEWEQTRGLLLSIVSLATRESR